MRHYGTIRIDDDIRIELKKEAAEQSRSMVDLINEIVFEYIKNQKAKRKLKKTKKTRSKSSQIL